MKCIGAFIDELSNVYHLNNQIFLSCVFQQFMNEALPLQYCAQYGDMVRCHIVYYEMLGLLVGEILTISCHYDLYHTSCKHLISIAKPRVDVLASVTHGTKPLLD